MKKFLSIVLSAAMIFSLAACGGSKTGGTKAADGTKAATEGTKAAGTTDDKASGDTVKIGMMISLTGSGVQCGEECQALAEIFEDVINNKHDDLNLPFASDEGLPNLGGKKIEFVIGDQSTTEIAQSEAERLITEEGVIGICGNFSSATTKTVMVVAEKYGVPVISEGTSMSLLEANYEYFGRSFPGDDLFIEESFNYLDALNKKGTTDIKTICLVSEDSEFGTNIANVEKSVAEKHGYEIVENISYNKDATNVTSEVMKVKAADADVVMMSSYAADALLFMNEYKTQNYFPKMLFGQRGGFMASDFAMNLGENSDYVLTTSRWNSDMDNDASRQLVDMFKEKTGLTLIGDTLTSVWDGIVIAVAANQAGSTDGAEIRKVMEEGVDVKSDEDPFGLEGYVYSGAGQNEYGRAIVLQYMGGALITVYPDSQASADIVYPAKGWNER